MIEEYDRIARLSGMDIFDRRDPEELGGFKFVIPGTALSAHDVAVRRDHQAHVWVLTYTDAGREWTGRAEDLTAAYLDLIADRCGLHETGDEQ